MLGPDAQPFDEPLDASGHRCRPQNGEEYIASKQERTRVLARQKRLETGADWCVCENGACGPTFAYEDISHGFTAIWVSGPIERGLLVRSTHADREENMFGFTKAALDLLAECVAEAAAATDAKPSEELRPSPTVLPVLQEKEDRFGGVEVRIRPGSVREVTAFTNELRAALERWRADGKRGVWLKLPLECHAYVSTAVAAGFAFHHATPDYVQLTQWLPPDEPSPLPRYAFTTIGVGGVVVNQQGHVLVVKERTSPSARMQGSFKLPGGLADPGEDFAETVSREVREETGVVAELEGVVSMRHAHARRFGQGDLYVVVLLRATSDEIMLDERELADARWMTREEIDARKETKEDAGQSLEDKISLGNWEMIDHALRGRLIEGVSVPSSKGVPTMLYRAPK